MKKQPNYTEKLLKLYEEGTITRKEVIIRLIQQGNPDETVGKLDICSSDLEPDWIDEIHTLVTKSENVRVFASNMTLEQSVIESEQYNSGAKVWKKYFETRNQS